MNGAVRVEALKLRRSPVGVVATLALLAGTLALLGGITAGIAGGSPELIAKVGPAARLDWQGLHAGAAQITAAGGLLGCGVVLAWIFGREFTDGTIGGLFALPVTRGQIALAKIVVYGLWVLIVAITLPLGLLGMGLMLGYGTPDGAAWLGLARLGVLMLLTGAVAVPVGWVATLTRSLLAAVGSAIALVVTAQVGALTGLGGWLPSAAPALWALSEARAVTPAQLGLTLAMAILFVGVTVASWSRLQLDR